MINKIMDGKAVAEDVLESLKKQIAEQKIEAKLHIVQVGNNESSNIYIKQKIKACERLGLECELTKLEDESLCSTESLLELLAKLNHDAKVTGIIVQLPLPVHIDKTKVIAAIDHRKDVDGLTPYNMGMTMLGLEFEHLTPCTAKGVCRMLEFFGVALDGKKVAMIGQGKITGKPIAAMMMNRHATVFSCNKNTPNLEQILQMSDIVIAAAGVPGLVKANMVQQGVVIVDVGITRLPAGGLAGDCDFDGLLEKASLISPVPGGVGKMTVAALMENLVSAALSNQQ